jgi:F-type H+-transporting ATPase subunit epsilon
VALEVHVVTPEREVWAGEARLLVARGVDGEVGIMGGHAPLLVRLDVGPLRVHADGGPDQVIVIDGGFLHVSSDEGATRADVLADAAELASEVDPAAARRRADELRERLDARDGLDADDRERLQRELKKANARVAVAG